MSSRFSVPQMSSEAKIFAYVNAQYIAMFSIGYAKFLLRFAGRNGKLKFELRTHHKQ
ncbi:MAG: hypothetical protein ACR2J3_09565 [Aridibacter sp.]